MFTKKAKNSIKNAVKLTAKYSAKFKYFLQNLKKQNYSKFRVKCASTYIGSICFTVKPGSFCFNSV